MRRRVKHLDEASGVWIREIADQELSQRREHRGVYADTERECEHGDHRESGISPKSARRETHVLYELLRPDPTTLIATLLLDLLDAAEQPPRGVAGFIGADA